MGGILIAGDLSRHYYLYPVVGFRYQPIKTGNLVFRLFANYPLSGRFYEDRLTFIPIVYKCRW